MKIKLNGLKGAPHEVAKISGGVTFEPEIGWWTQSEDLSVHQSGVAFEDERDAAYIPTLQKTGTPVSKEVVTEAKRRAVELGLDHITCASGMWILSETGEPQVETIWIAHGRLSDRSGLKKLASYIRQEANQDCVAWEEGGKLNFAAGMAA
ncbi:MAG: hypothetical protein EXS51_02790 [Candidatus Taylorbacteria bacterium]|nr:hypothetical protein [Candidatus Taylorbacteria bacterium]